MRRLLVALFVLLMPALAGAQDPGLSPYVRKSFGIMTGPLRFKGYASGSEPIACSAAEAGDTIYSTTSNAIRYCNGTTWGDVGGGLLSGAGAADRLAVWSGATTLTSDGDLTWTGGNQLNVTGTVAITGALSSSGGAVTFGSLTATRALFLDASSIVSTTGTSAALAASVSDEQGSGSLVFATSPTLTTPTIGVATATSVNKVAITAPASAATLTLSDGSSLITSGGHSITLTSTGTTNVTLPTSGTLLVAGGAGTVSGLTAGRVPVASSAVALTDYATFLYDGTTLTASVASIGTTGTTVGASLDSATAASGGAMTQYSPGLRFTGYHWTGSASANNGWRIQERGTNSTAATLTFVSFFGGSDNTATIALTGSSTRPSWGTSTAHDFSLVSNGVENIRLSTSGGTALTYHYGLLGFPGNSVASSAEALWYGTWYSGGSSTTTKPHVQIEPSGATSNNWSTSGTGFGVNAANAFAGNLIDAQVNAVRKFRADASGNLFLAGTVTTYNNTTTTESGVPSFQTTSISLTGQTANVGATNVKASAAAGRYRMCAVTTITTAASVSSSLPVVNLIYTDVNGGAVKTIALTSARSSNTTATGDTSCGIANVSNSTDIQYSTTDYASVGGTAMQYDLYITLENL